jgi:hypothetical protein
MKHLITAFLCLLSFCSFSQTAPVVHRDLNAVRTNQKIIIDGDISDSAWKTAALATDFVEWQPDFGKAEDKKSRTEVYLLYDDNAIYVAGFCHEASADSVSKELVGRDVVGTNDFVGVLFDTYNDKINGFGYYVTPLGEQYDAKYSNTGEDGSWNSVYKSEAKIVKGGWTFEMKIPYSAIRFTKKDVQTWGIQIIRRRSKAGKKLMWNPFNPNIGGTLFAQAGVFNNIIGVKPPVRLSIAPFVSAYADHYPYNQPGVKNWANNIYAGIDDLKYGINQSLTLDLTLLPDFGQVQSDNDVLNLTPFEVKYAENRTFFTEGTDLFNKGSFFYSRRIGGAPLHYYDVYNELNANEVVTDNPGTTKLISAVKVSGRTSDGWGVGVLNAVTDAQYATVEDTATKTSRQIQTSPVTNYNVIALDKSLKNNSSISFVNTSVWRGGSDYDANVTAFLWDFYDKKNVYNFSGKFAESQLYGYNADGSSKFGHLHNFAFVKQGGRFNFQLSQEAADSNYQQNDIGYATNSNYLNNDLWLGYKWIKPKSFYNNLYFNINSTYSLRYNQGDYQSFYFNTNLNGTLKNLWNGGVIIYGDGASNDFYEPRVEGLVFKRPSDWGGGFWMYTNTAKKYSTGLEFYYTHVDKFNGDSYQLLVTNQFRFNKKITILLNNNFTPNYNNVGFAYDSINAVTGTNDVYFGNRNRITLENILSLKYNFNNKMGITFRARHYWSKVDYKQFYHLNPDGNLDPTSLVFDNDNVNFFNIDMLYTWQFALGSFLNIGWKNSIATDNTLVTPSYIKNAGNTFSAPQNNNFSIKVIYFLDYLNLKKHKS